MVTSRDVARLAGVPQSTVSYVMSGRRSISPETRRRVEEAIETLGFQPNAGARALASQRSQVIGLVVPFAAGDGRRAVRVSSAPRWSSGRSRSASGRSTS